METLTKISIDISSICQLKCPACSTGIEINKNGLIGSGFMSFENFKTLIESLPNIKEVELSNWGEIFLNPGLPEILKFGFLSNLKLTAGNGVNFNKVDDEVLEALVKYRFSYLNISIDGASQETYEKYRIGGNFNKVIRNIKALNFFKHAYNSQFPLLAWQFIIFGHNEHEIPIVQDQCIKLKMVFNPKLNHSDFSPIKDKEWVKKITGLSAVTRDEFRRLNGKHYKRPCCQFWVSPQINWDGKLLGCCVNKWTSFGNIFEDGLISGIESQLYKETKLALTGKAKRTPNMPCFYCPTFTQIIETPITEEEIQSYSAFIHPAERQ